jgi:hypothetical protein
MKNVSAILFTLLFIVGFARAADTRLIPEREYSQEAIPGSIVNGHEWIKDPPKLIGELQADKNDGSFWHPAEISDQGQTLRSGRWIMGAGVGKIVFTRHTVLKIGRLVGDKVIEPGVVGDALCMSGLIMAVGGDNEGNNQVLVEMNAVRFIGTAYPDYDAHRILVKVGVMVTAKPDGEIKEITTDGYLQGADGKPGFPAEYSLADNTLTLKAGTKGKMVFLRSAPAL